MIKPYIESLMAYARREPTDYGQGESVLFVTHFVGIGCYLMAGGCFLIAVVGCLMGLAPFEEIVRTLGIGFGFFVVALVGERVVTMMDAITGRISI